MPSTISKFIKHHYRHFNSAALVDAAEAYKNLINENGQMLLAMAGAMSTAELGISLAEMIRQDKIHAISCTGANLEEDIFNLVANSYYKRIPNYRELSPEQEEELLSKHLNRVTDTCIPEEEALRRIEDVLLEEWVQADQNNKQLFPHEFFYKVIREGKLKKFYDADEKNSWMVAAAEKNIPIFVPGWEDSSMGNIYASHCIRGDIKNVNTVKGGIDYMISLFNWYKLTSLEQKVGFFQIGGGIAGDFPICVVPMMRQDLLLHETPLWSYFCQISDSTTSYGSYSGAVPNEKITWEKLSRTTPKFIIESDATIVAPLIFAYVLGW